MLILTTQGFYSLSDLLLRAVPPWVVHALWEVLDESDPLGNADLLLLCQLSGQSGLAGCWVVDRHMDLLLQNKGRAVHTGFTEKFKKLVFRVGWRFSLAGNMLRGL